MTKQAEANRLYWGTNMPVAEIAESLDLSRRALYDVIEAVPADTACAVCGAMMQYTNRSARDGRNGTCFVCATASPQVPQPVESAPWTWSPEMHAAESKEAVQRADLADRARRLGGAALLGAIIGAGATYLLLGRD
jgi:hypothetical protein